MIAFRALADDKATFTASAPDAVAVGDQFRLSYVVTTQNNVRDFRAPAIKAFDVLMGPMRSQQYSRNMVNGKSTTSSSITFTYTLMATKEGTYTIPGATLQVEGNQLISNSVTIKVLPADQSGALESGEPRGSKSTQSGNSIGASDLFITGTVSKTSVYEQEALLLTYKIYSAVDLRSFDNIKLPDFKGFHSQEVELPANRKWGLEHYQGRNYQTTVYRQFVLFPQQSGKLTINAARFDASIAKATQVIDPFDAFFNGGGFVEVKKTLLTPTITLEVKPLPAGKPEGFSGGVGEFSITSTLSNTQVKTNDAITLKVAISGTGNLKLIATPEVKFPDEFEVYDPKVENKSRLISTGLSGSKVIDYLAIPRNAGTFKIPPVTFSYFDLKSKSYKTLSTQPYTLDVLKGEGNASQTIANFTSKEELKVLNEDIRFIKQHRVSLHKRGDYFFGSAAYWTIYLLAGVAFIFFVLLYRRQIAANANLARMRTKKANSVAVRRLKMAGRLLAENKKEPFYDEVMKALWGYISDKLNIPLSRLSKENIREELQRYGVDAALTDEFIHTLNQCEFARFAPGNDNQAMDNVYNHSLEVIGKMEKIIKK